MNNNRGGERTIYDESLFRIFLWSGFPIFMILLFACVAISGIVFIYRHSDPEGVKIIIFCFAVLIPVSYGSPFVSLFKAWKQQHKIGIFWKERTDHHLPEWKRDWYLICDRTFEDIDGKKHTLKFSYESWALEFQKWFEKQTYEKENVEL